MAVSFTCKHLNKTALRWGVVFSSLLFATPVLANDCRESFDDPAHTIRACNVVIASPVRPMPAIIRALQIRAQALILSGKPNLAIIDYTSALERLPKGQLQGYILYQRGQVRLNMPKQQALALKDLEQANTQAPANTRILEALATAYANNNRPVDVIRISSEILIADQRSVIARKIRARVYERLGKTRLLLADLDTLLTHTPHDHALLIWRGRIHQNRNNVFAALTDLRRAARIRSTDDIMTRIKQLEVLLQN